MGDISFALTKHSPYGIDEVWARMESGRWPILDGSQEPRIGGPVYFTLPHPAGGVHDASGRVTALERGVSITIAQEAPWTGTIKLTFTSEGVGTRIRAIVTLGEDCVPWMLDRSMVFDGEHHVRPRQRLRIGMLVCLSGVAGILGRSSVNAIRLAIDRLNADDAFGSGLQAQLVLADDHTSPRTAAAALRRLALVDRCDVVITNVSSASTAVLLPLAAELGVLILDASPGMSRRSGAFDIHLGARPIDYLSCSVPAAMSEFDARDWVIIGSDYIWPHRIGALADQVISSHQGRIRDAITVPLGAREFDAELERIAGSGAQLVLSSLVGIDAALFERAAYASGLRSSFRTLVVNMDNAVLEHTGPEAAAGLWALHDRFLGAGSDSLEFDYQARFGCKPPLLSGMAQNCADAVALYAEAVRHGGSSDAKHVRQQIARLLDPAADSKTSRRGCGLAVPVDITEITRQGQRTVLAS